MLELLRRLFRETNSCRRLSRCFATFALAQVRGPSRQDAAPAAPYKDPVATSLRMLLQRSQNNTVGAVEAMPADKFSYKPTPDQMTFAHLVVHIIGFNNSFCAKAADVPAPKVEEPKETDSKDQLVAAVKASFAFCSEAARQDGRLEAGRQH